MELFPILLAVLEMLCVNLYTFHICSQKKARLSVIIFVISIFTVLFFGLFYMLMKDTAIPGNGSLMLCGMAYLAPLTFLYRQPVTYSISIMCSCWIYTMLVYALSLQLAGFFPEPDYFAALLLIQTALYVFTIHPFFRFLQKKFIYIIKSSDHKTKRLLFWLGISWFMFVLLLNYTLIVDMSAAHSGIAKILTLCMTGINAFATYQIFYSFRRENQSASEFENALRIDALTRQKNRTAFFEEAQALIDNHTSLIIYFIDLNYFKSVNDTYGHLRGDLYLKHFSDSFSSYFFSLGTFYRIAGDEFVFLHVKDKHDHSLSNQIDNFDMHDCGGIPFKGFSVGSASYPEDAQTLNLLIAAADKRMYEEKERARVSH